MSGTYPTNPVPRRLDVSSVQPTFVSTAHALNRQSRTRNAQAWSFRLQYPRTAWSDLAPLVAFLQAQRGRYDTFAFALPLMYANGAGGGTPLAVGATSTGGSVDTNGWPNTTTVLKAGDFIKWANHSKIYMVTADATTNGSGEVTVEHQPHLVDSVADNEALAIHTAASRLEWTVALDEDTLVIERDVGDLFRVDVGMAEIF